MTAQQPVMLKIRAVLESLTTRPRTMSWVAILVFVGLVSPTVVNYSPYPLTWDESYYMGRIICADRAVYSHSLARLGDCLAHTHKGPIMELVNLPWGKAGGSEPGIGLAFVGLAFFIWLLALAAYTTCLRAGIPPTSLLIAATVISLTPFLRVSSGAMMTDTLLAWCIALALALIPLEYTRPSTKPWPSLLRGLLWSLVVNVGMNAKVTFAFFMGIIGIALILIRERYSGEYPLRYAFFGCIAGCLPSIVLWRYYGLNFLRFAVMVAWGDLAKLWSVAGLTPGGYLKRYFLQLGWALIPLCILVGLFIYGIVVEREKRFARLLPLGIILAYLGVAARSQNRDPRFGIPIMVAMPICLAWTSVRKRPEFMVRAPHFLLALFLGTALALPMVKRPDLAPIRRTEALLSTLSETSPTSGDPIKVVIATDGPTSNIDTFLLARQLAGASAERIELDTLVYDAVNKRTLDDGLRRIDAANYVLFLKAGLPPGADWARTWSSNYRSHCEKVGSLLDPRTSPDMDVFRIGKANLH